MTPIEQEKTTADMIDSFNPATNTLLGSMAVSSADEVHASIARAQMATESWRAMSVAERSKAVEAILKKLKSHAEHLGNLITGEMGKPIQESHREIEEGFECIQWYIDQAKRSLKARVDQNEAHEVHCTNLIPYGVTAVIVPWNFPFLNVVWPLFPNLLAGNTVVLKHSEKTPLFAKALSNLMQPLLPKGVFELVTGGQAVGQTLCQSNVDQICFTGSSKAGLEIQKNALTNSLEYNRTIPVHTELGGSAAGIVLEDADIHSTAAAIFKARFENAGQVCDGLKRLIIHRSLASPITEMLKQLIANRQVGRPENIQTHIGPLVDEKQRLLAQHQVDEAKSLGAHTYCSDSYPTEGSYYPATLVFDVTSDMRIWQEEVFAPVLPIVIFDTEQEAIKLANDTKYGLGGYIYSSDFERIKHLREQLNTGMVGTGSSHYVRPFVPFTSGGYGLSGSGTLNGPEAFSTFCRTQVTSYPKSIYQSVETNEARDTTTTKKNQFDTKKDRAREILVKNGIWIDHNDDVVEIAPYELPMRVGKIAKNFRVSPWVFHEGTLDEDTYFAASYGHENFSESAPLVRLQSLCPHGHYFHSSHCDCDEQRDLAMQMLRDDSVGGVLVMAAGEKHAGRGIGQVMIAGLYSYGYSTGRDVVTESFNDLGFNRDERDFSASLEILRRMGLTKIRLLTNNPDKVSSISKAQGIEVVEVVPVIGDITPESLKERLLLTREGHHYDRSELGKATDEAIESFGHHPLDAW